MSDAAPSVAARALVSARWGNRKPVRLARELLPRLAELPAAERVRLQNALSLTEERHRYD